MTHEELREKVAAAMWNREFPEYPWGKREYLASFKYREFADAALAVVRAALREPSEGMIFAAADLPSPCLFSTVWRAMLAASPLAEPQKEINT